MRREILFITAALVASGCRAPFTPSVELINGNASALCASNSKPEIHSTADNRKHVVIVGAYDCRPLSGLSEAEIEGGMNIHNGQPNLDTIVDDAFLIP